MKKLFLFCLTVFISYNLFSTDVSGDQSGIWNLAGSPYNLIGEITIPANQTLNIEAGVEVIAMGNYKITALGNIVAIGTLNDTIRFHGDGGLNWGGIRLEDEVLSSVFYFCRISNTDDTNDYGIHSINSRVTIEHSYFDDHQRAISFSALSSNNPAAMTIRWSKIANIEKSGITVVDNSNVLIISNEITRCGLGSQFYGAIQLSLQNSSHTCNPTIFGNYIHHNDKQGLTLANLFGYDNMAPFVDYNEICNNYTGIYLYNGKGTFTRNNIHHNFEENNPDSGAGVILYGNGADAVFTYNSIHHNYTGFYLTNGATVNLGDLNNTSTDDDGYNCIYDNLFFTGDEYTIYNSSSADVTAENCVWDDDPPIDTTIIDGNDNASYGIVDYEPMLSPYAPLKEISVYINGNFVNFQFSYETAYPTYLQGIEGYNVYQDGYLIGELTGTFFINLDTLVPGQVYTFGISIVYEGGYESTITETTITIPLFNPPLNANSTSNGYVTWEEPEPGSTSPFLHYNIYLDGALQATTTELFYQLEGLVNGQSYLVGLSAEYEAGESAILEFDFAYVDADETLIPQNRLLGNYPNPFNPTTTISFNLTTNLHEKTRIEIYNLKGQKIKTLFVTLSGVEGLDNNNIKTSSPSSSLRMTRAGSSQYSVTWNGTDQNNQPVSSGIYFYRLISDGKNIDSRKMMLLK